MARFCEKCGARLSDGAQFCPGCGARIAQPVQQTYQQPVYAPPVQTSRQTGPKRSKGFKIAVITLAVIMGIEGVIAGVWYPGFFTGGNTGDHNDNTTANTGISGSHPDLSGICTTDELALRYTEEQIANAPTESAALTTDGGDFELGDVSAHFNEYVLDEDCELVVRDLPVLTENGENQVGNSIKAYDFTLSSGQETFDTDVEITIPRTVRDGETGSCIWYNEIEDRWENIYSEVSEDGSYYRIYTTHFTEVAEKKYIFDPQSLTVTVGDKESYNLSDGIFYASSEYGTVGYYPEQMWAMANNKQIKDVENYYATLKNVNTWINSTDLDYAAEKAGDWASILFGAYSSSGGYTELFGWQKTAPQYISLQETGKVCACADAMLTVVKILIEATKNAYKTDGGWQQSFINACNDHALDIAGSILGLIGLGLGTGTVGAIVYALSLGCYVYSTYSSLQKPEPTFKNDWGPDAWTPYAKSKIKTDEDFYHYYLYNQAMYFEGDTVNSYDQNSEWHLTKISRLEKLSDEEYASFRNLYTKEVVRKGLTFIKEKSVPYGTLNITRTWTRLFKALILTCSSPKEFDDRLDELLTNIVSAYWELPHKQMDAYFKEMEEFGYDISQVSPYTVKEDIKNIYIKEAKQRLREEFLPLIKDVSQTIMHDAMSQYLHILDNFVKYLNTPMEFYVVDESVDDFKDSLYCVDYTTLIYNQKKLKESETVRVDDLHLPMKFHGVTEPLFLPLKPVGHWADWAPYDKSNYYPYDLDCCMKPMYSGHYGKSDKPVNNRVFCCTVYQYLMLGAPGKMDFYNLAEVETETPSCITVDLEIPAYVPGETIQVTARLNGDDLPVGDHTLRVKEFSSNADVSEGSSSINSSSFTNMDVPDARVSAKADRTVEIFIPGYNQKENKDYGKKIVRKYYRSQNDIKLKGEFSHEPDRYDFEEGGMVCKIYYVTDCSLPIERHRKTEQYEEGTLSKTYTKDLTMSDLIMKGPEDKLDENSRCSRIFMYYSPKDPNQLMRVAINLTGSKGTISIVLSPR